MCDEKRRSVCISLCEGPNMARVWQSSKKTIMCDGASCRQRGSGHTAVDGRGSRAIKYAAC